jgi:glutathione S-transferase
MLRQQQQQRLPVANCSCTFFLQARLISRFHDLYLEPALRKLYPHVAPATRDPAAVAAAAQEFTTRLAQLELILTAQLPSGSSSSSDDISAACSYAVGNSLTLADCGYPALFAYAELIFPVLGLGQLAYAGLPRIQQWREVLWQNPSVASVLQELQPAAQEWVDSKQQLTEQQQQQQSL